MSPAGKAIASRIVVVLTATAEHYAAQNGILERVLAIALPAQCQVGDFVSLEVGGVSHEFGIMRRRWVAGEDSPRLEITLDQPARGGRWST